MSVAEMKKIIHQQIDTIENEAALKGVLEHIAKLNENSFDLESFFEKAAEQYGNVLQKLAQ